MAKLTRQEKVYAMTVMLMTAGNGLKIVDAIINHKPLVIPIIIAFVSWYFVMMIKRSMERQELEKELNRVR